MAQEHVCAVAVILSWSGLVLPASCRSLAVHLVCVLHIGSFFPSTSSTPSVRGNSQNSKTNYLSSPGSEQIL